MRVRLRYVLLAAAAVVAAGVVWFVGRDGSSIVLDPVAKAASSTSSESFRFTFRATGASAGDVRGAGAYDADDERLRLGFDVPSPAGGSMRMDVVTDTSDGAVVYGRFPLLAPMLHGKTWLRLDVAKLAGTHGVDLTQLLQANQGSPGPMLDALVKSSVSMKLGRETVGGVETTHYRAAVDPKEYVLAQLAGAAREQLEQALRSASVATLPIDVWVGDDGLVRRLRVHVPEGRSGNTVTFTEELSGYGDHVDVALPDDADTFDLSSLKLG